MKEQQINMRHLADNIEKCFIQLENNVKMLSDALSEKRFPKEETAEETALALKDMKRLRESVAALARQVSRPAPDSLSDIRSLIDSFETQLERERLLEFILHLRAVPPTSDELLANLKSEARKVLSDQTASCDAVAEFALVRQFVLSTRDLHDMERYGSIATRFGFPLFVAVIQELIVANMDGEEERTPQTPAVENDDVPGVETPVEPEAPQTFEEPEKVLRVISNPVEKLAAKEITKENKWAKGMSRHFLPIKLLGFMGIASARQMGLAIGDKALNQSIEHLKKEGYLGEAAFYDDAFSKEPLYFLASRGQALLANSNCLAALEKYGILQKSEKKKLLLFNPDEFSAVSRSLYRLNDFWNDAFFSRLNRPCLWMEKDPKTETPFLVAQGTLSEAQSLMYLFAEANEKSEAAISQRYSGAVRVWISSDEQAAAWAARHKSDFTVFWRAPGIVREVFPDGDAVCEDKTVTQFIESLLAETAEKSHAPASEQAALPPSGEAGGRSEDADIPVSDDEKRGVEEASPVSGQERSLSGNETRESVENYCNDTLPEPPATETPPVRQIVRDAEFISKITRTMTEQLRQKRFAEVCLLLRSSAPYDETGELAALSELLEFALGDPAASRNDMVTMSKLTNDLQKLQESDDDWSPIVSCLRVAGNLRLLCVGRKDRNYERYHLDKEMQSCLDDENMSVLPHLKEAFNLLRTLVKNTDLNLEEACKMDDSSANRNPLNFPKMAAEFLERTRQLSTKQYKHEKANDVLHRFYRDDPIIDFMKVAEKDETSQSGACMEFCSDFLAKNQEFPTSVDDVTVWSDQAVDNYIDKLWDASRVKTRQKNDKFKGDLRNTTTKNFKDMLSILACWFADVETRNRSGTDIISWRQKKPQLIQAFQEMEAECDSVQDGDTLLEPFVNILGSIAHEYGDILSGGISARDKRYFYLSFLRTCHVELEERDGAYLPVKEEDIPDLPEFRLCERVLRHCQEPLPSWKEVVQSIFQPISQPDGEHDVTKCDDFGQARLILNYLTETGQNTEEIWPQEFSLEKKDVSLAVSNSNNEYERFIGDVETALNRGQLQFPNENERIVSMVSLRKTHYRKTHNFGFLRRLMQAYKRRISEEGEERGRNLRERLESKREALTLDGKALPIVDTIEELLKRGECTLAEDYLSKAGAGMGELSIEYNSNSSRQVNDYLNRFMDEYNRIYESCRLLNRKTADVYYSLYGSGPITRDSKATARFLNNWFPKTSEQILQFLESLDFHVQQGTLKKLPNPKGPYGLYEVQIAPGENGASDYNHPIAAFGSSCRTLRLILLAGVLKYKEILNRIQHDGGNTALVLMEGSLPLNERRNFAKEMKQQRKATYCLIDRPLMIFLSRYMPYERKQAMLACALPFSFYQPYTEGSSVRIPPEMFRGRQSERISIQSFDGGANLVYGGRQLGKTALLDRVASDFNQVNGQTAIKITIREKRYDKVAEMIADELIRAGLVPSLPQGASMDWEKLFYLLRDNIGPGHPCQKLLLMLDEGDEFLKSCFEVKYKPIDYLKDLQSEALPERFKFVIAGLRNLVEFDHKYRTPNSPLGHLHHLQIGPLSYQDARELFELPLSYLGIQVPTDEESQRMLNRILATTNYYPGLIQFYCNNLIETLASEYERCGYRLKDSPPYQLSETHVHTVLQDIRFQKAIEDKFKMTLDLGKDNPDMKDSENYYLILASVLAYAYYQQEYHNKCTLAQFRHICSQFGISRITSLTDENISAFLQEMCILNIFSSDGGNPPSYSFSRHNFFLMMGSEEELWQKLCDEFGGMA